MKKLTTLAMALLVGGCVLGPPLGKEVHLYAGLSAEAVLDEQGHPDFRHEDVDAEYLGYRLQRSSGASAASTCSAVYTVRRGEVAAVDLVGAACHKTKGSGSVNALAEGLAGKSIGEALLIVGVPTFSDLVEGTGRMIYDFDSGSAPSGPIGSGQATGGVSLRLGCELEIRVAQGVVESAETGGGRCWSTFF